MYSYDGLNALLKAKGVKKSELTREHSMLPYEQINNARRRHNAKAIAKRAIRESPLQKRITTRADGRLRGGDADCRSAGGSYPPLRVG